jgi:hypothetical protein
MSKTGMPEHKIAINMIVGTNTLMQFNSAHGNAPSSVYAPKIVSSHNQGDIFAFA